MFSHTLHSRLFTALFPALWLVCAACAPTPTPIATPAITPRPVTTAQAIVIADAPASATPMPTATRAPYQPTATTTLTPTPAPTPSFWQLQVENLFDLSRLPLTQNSVTTQFTSRNWVSREYFFDYFIDDGNFEGPNYGYLDEQNNRISYRIVPGYDGKPEYEIVPRVEGPGEIVRLWFAYQQHQSYNNPQDMSQNEEWGNWGNLGAMGNIRFYFDDEPAPRMDVGIKELFVGKSPFPAPLAAFYASANGGNINYVPIPFARSLRVTTTGRPRLMQIQVKRFLPTPPPITRVSHSAQADDFPRAAPRVETAPTLSSFTPILTPAEQATLDQAAHAWRTCAPRVPGEYRAFPFTLAPDTAAAIAFNSPGTVAGLRVRVPADREQSVWLQIFWDDESEPSINAPLRALFGTAERLLPYAALPLGIVTDGDDLVFYNNFPMPFQSARFVLLNRSDAPLPLTFDAVLRETVPGTERARLRAFYGSRRVTRREDAGDNYVVIDVKGRGKYLGLILNAWDLDREALNMSLPQTWRFPYLESNVDVWIDGRLALPGTGIEDDFNASYYYVFTGYPGYNSKYCLAGVTLLDYDTLSEPSSQYRFYLNDAPEFRDHLRVEVQHGNKGNNLSVTYSSTAFWYEMR